MRPPRQLRQMFAGKLLRVMKPLYGIVEAPSYWQDTYITAYTSRPTLMVQSFLDECLLYAASPRIEQNDTSTSALSTPESTSDRVVEDVVLSGMAAVLVDDSLLTGNTDFADTEQEMNRRFEN
jgi:hypothetical protein